MSITIPFRKILRSAALDIIGAKSVISHGVHILNGHTLEKKDIKHFKYMLSQLSNSADLISLPSALELINDITVNGTDTYIAFTFDDGYEECYTNIAPALDEYDVKGAYFVNPAYVGASSESIGQFFKEKAPDMAPRKFMTIDMIKELSNMGSLIGAHTMSHERLVGLSEVQLKSELLECKRYIEDVTEKPCDFFAWTYGKFSDIDEKAIIYANTIFKNILSSDSYNAYKTEYYGVPVVSRRHFECDWKLSHVRHFLSKNRS